MTLVSPCVRQDLFLGKPLDLLSLLDEQSKFPQATDSKLVVKFNDTFKKKKTIFIASKGSASGTFAIQHYAGKVGMLVSAILARYIHASPLRLCTIHLVSWTRTEIVCLVEQWHY